MTHIQFLTILYPSTMEERLIFGLLGGSALRKGLSQALTQTSRSSGSPILIIILPFPFTFPGHEINCGFHQEYLQLHLGYSIQCGIVDLGVRDGHHVTYIIIFSDPPFSFLINREEAWRTDGGTAIFGGGAIALSLFSIGLNLYQVCTYCSVCHFVL
jgi:hypothetical protein